MFGILTAICCFLIIASEGRRDRASKTECRSRSCCMQRREVPEISDTPCETLSVTECGAHDETCVWDCYPNQHQVGKRGVTDRHFVRVSDMKGKYVEPQFGSDEGPHDETFEECMSSGQLIERDDCGVEYKDTMDQELLRQFCERNHKSAKATAERTAPDSDIDDDDDITDIGTSDRRRTVFGHDGRIEIPSYYRNHYLFRTTVFISYWDGSSHRRCTAFMISKHWAITAAHCVYGNGDWYGHWNIWSHVHSCSDRRNSRNRYYGLRAITFNGYINAVKRGDWNSQKIWDIAWIQLNRGTNFGSFGLGYSTGFRGDTVFDVISYPVDKPDCKKYYQRCVWSGWTSDLQFTSVCDIAPGAGGAPVFKYVRGLGHVVFAVMTGENKYHNAATRITKSKFNAIRNFVR